MDTLVNFLKKENRWIALLLFFGFLIVYILTASRTVTQGDTGEFLATAAVGGVPHEPGYPLYSLLIRLAYFLPFGNPAWQINGLSGLFAAGAVVFVYKIVKEVTKNSAAAIFGALALATYESFWFYALVAEVHALHVLLLAALFFYVILALKYQKPKDLYIGACIFGLGIANNETIIFAVPSCLAVLFFLRKKLTKKILAILVLLSSSGFLLYGYTFITAIQNPPVNWGGIHNFQTLLDSLLRKDFGSFLLGSPEPPAPFQFHSFVYYFESIIRTSWYVIPFVIFSCFFFKKDAKKVLSILFIGFILYGPFYYAIINLPVRSVVHQANIEQYIAYPFLFLSIFAGIGASYIFERFFKIKEYFVVLLVIAFFLIPSFMTFEKVRQDNDTFVDQTSQYMLSEVPKNAVLLVWSDSLYMPAQYQIYLKKYRPDIVMIQLGIFNSSWYRDELTKRYPDFAQFIAGDHINYQKICSELAPQNKLYFYPWYQEFDIAFAKGCTLVPYGLIVKVIPTKSVPPIENVIAYNNAVWHDYVSKVNPYSYANRSVRTQEGLFYLSEQLNFTGLYYFKNKRIADASSLYTTALAISQNQTNAIINQSSILYHQHDYVATINLLKEGIIRNPTNDALYKNIGVIYLQLNDKADAYKYIKKYLQFPRDDPDRQVLTQFVTEYETAMSNSSLGN